MTRREEYESKDVYKRQVHTGSKSHIGAVVVTTAWTLADGQGGNGKDFLEAVIVGYEIMARVGMAMDVVSNRKRGWHTTGVIGTFGAAAAAGHLLGLDEEEMVSAFGMAGTQSSGLWALDVYKRQDLWSGRNGMGSCTGNPVRKSGRGAINQRLCRFYVLLSRMESL